MKRLYKPAAVFLVLLMITTVFSVIGATALTFDNYGDYKLVLTEEDTYYLYSYTGEETHLNLPITVNDKPVLGIYGSCFENSAIESVVIPDNYITIGDSAFSNCVNLKSIVIPPIIESIGEFAFYNCTALESVDMSRATEIEAIPYGAFSGCKALSEVMIPPNLKKIKEYAFYNTAVESVDFPETVTDLSEGSFSECKVLKDVKLPTSLKKIGRRAFYNSRSIDEIFIPKSVTSIGEEAFEPMMYSNSISINVIKDSAAEEYCQKNNVQNIVSILFGDANNDGKLNISDATAVQKHVAGIAAIESLAVKDAADVSGDGKVTVRDATLIQMRVAGIITSF
ncbi:MAG: leucine-rich repeat protein [Ruminococcus sp.]|nr:leucine-rich repeat protein [Ruminococcus sp.]